MGKQTVAFFMQKGIRLKHISEFPIPSVGYRNNIVSAAATAYMQLAQYVPRILAKISKYTIIKWILVQLNLNYGWLLVILMAIL